MRGSNHDPPKSSDKPRRAKISEKRAFWLATTRSHPSAMLHPAPTATPRTLAIVGIGKRWSVERDVADVAHLGQLMPIAALRRRPL